MPEVIITHLGLIQQLSYLGVFLLMAMSGHIIPIPQDISLISVGYLAALGYIHIVPALILGILAPIASDAFLYYLSHHGSRFAPKPEKYADTWIYKFSMHHMHNRTILTVILMRFVTGFRFMSPVMGAYMSVPVKKYFIANSISALIFGPVFVLLGYVFHKQITTIIDTLKSVEHFGGIAFVIVVVLIFGFFIRNRYNTSNAQE